MWNTLTILGMQYNMIPKNKHFQEQLIIKITAITKAAIINSAALIIVCASFITIQL